MVGRKNINQGSVALVSWVIIVSINFFQMLYVKYSVPGKFDWDDVFYYPISSFTIGVLLIYSFLLPIFKKVRELKIGLQIPLFIIHGLLYTTIYIIFIFFQIALWSDNLNLNSFSETIKTFFSTDFHNIAKNYIFLMAIYIAVEYVNKREIALLKQRELESQLKESKLQALESKLHPHFLFNALNGITALVNENPEKAEKAIVELSDLLRFTLEVDLQSGILLKEELLLLEKYISIEKMRFEDQLEIEIWSDVKFNSSSKTVPPLILQPIIENAIIHGFKEIEHPLKISIQVHQDKITIINNGAPLHSDKKNGIGLTIVQQRLRHHFGDEVKLSLKQTDGNVVCEINGLDL